MGRATRDQGRSARTAASAVRLRHARLLICGKGNQGCIAHGTVVGQLGVGVEAVGLILAALIAGVVMGTTNGVSQTIEDVFARLRRRFGRATDEDCTTPGGTQETEADSSGQFGNVHAENNGQVQIGNHNTQYGKGP